MMALQCLFLACFVSIARMAFAAHNLFTCEPVRLRMCQDLSYNMTFMPNVLGHYDQETAARAMEAFHPLVNLDCHADLRLFLCATFTPPCHGVAVVARPCRAVCYRARHACSHLAEIFGVTWPGDMDCQDFADCDGVYETSEQISGHKPELKSSNGQAVESQSAPRDLGFWCPRELRMVQGLGYRFLGAVDCSPPCRPHMFFSRAELTLSRYFIGAMAVVCLSATLFAVLTFLIDVRRFRYPERPIVFYSLCYLAVALAYLVGALIGPDAAACNMPGHEHGTLATITQGSHRRPCTLLFALLYFFTLAGAAWWVVLTITWFLAAGLKWGSEAIGARAPLFHGAAWGLPGAQTALLLALGAPEGDPLSGVCFVGIQDASALRWYLLAPLGACVATGLGLLAAGFVSVNRVRLVIQHDARNQEKLVKFMIRVGVFSALYLLPLGALLGCYLYEQAFREAWERGWLLTHCRHFHIPCPPAVEWAGQPDITIVLLKYLMTLLVGIPSVFWVGSRKTCSEWASFLHRGKRNLAFGSQAALDDTGRLSASVGGRIPARATPTPSRGTATRASRGTSTQGSSAALEVRSRTGSYGGSLHRQHDGRRTPGGSYLLDDCLVYCSLPRASGHTGWSPAANQAQERPVPNSLSGSLMAVYADPCNQASPAERPTTRARGEVGVHSRQGSTARLNSCATHCLANNSQRGSMEQLEHSSKLGSLSGLHSGCQHGSTERLNFGSQHGSMVRLHTGSRQGSITRLNAQLRQRSAEHLNSASRDGSRLRLVSAPQQGNAEQLDRAICSKVVIQKLETSSQQDNSALRERVLQQSSTEQLDCISRHSSVTRLVPMSRYGSTGRLDVRSRQGSTKRLDTGSRQGSLARLDTGSRQGSMAQLDVRSRQGSMRDMLEGNGSLSHGNSWNRVLDEER
uniref:Frizzled class receptor 3b n=1 Tax=Eptatretus burgeri TaxID=7764 RepID=A0A8C4N4Z9_EPTBU